MKKTAMRLAVMLMALVVLVPTMAQEATQEAPAPTVEVVATIPPVETPAPAPEEALSEASLVTVLSVAVVALSVLCIILIALVFMLLQKMGANLDMVRDMIPAEFLKTINTTIDERTTALVAATKNPYDDAIWGLVKPLLEASVKTITASSDGAGKEILQE